MAISGFSIDAKVRRPGTQADFSAGKCLYLVLFVNLFFPYKLSPNDTNRQNVYLVAVHKKCKILPLANLRQFKLLYYTYEMELQV